LRLVLLEELQRFDRRFFHVTIRAGLPIYCLFVVHCSGRHEWAMQSTNLT
jgi:hypothetical protein